MSHEDKYFKYKKKYLFLKKQFGGEIDNDFTYFESCIGKKKLSTDTSIKIRSRTELLQYLIDKKSLVDSEAKKLNKQLTIIDEYIAAGERIKNGTRLTRPEAEKDFDENVLRKVAKVALMVCKTSGKYPRDNQLIAVLQFLEGKNLLLQAGTGQGKSLIVAMIAILQKKLKVPYNQFNNKEMAVHVITATDDLALDGRLSNKKLFDACSVKARGINDPGDIDDIVYGTPFDFEAQALFEASDPTEPRKLLTSSVRRTVILDESDSHLVDNASGRVLTSDVDPFAALVKDILKYLADKVIESYSSKKYNVSQEIKRITVMFDEWVNKYYPDFVNRWNSEKTVWIKNAFIIYDPNTKYRDGVNFILKKSLFDEIEDIKRDHPTLNILPLILAIENFYKNSKALDNLKNIIKVWVIKEDDLPPESKSRYHRIIDLIKQIQDKNAEQTYGLLFVGAIQYLDVGTGQIISNMKFSNGIQEFLEYKYFKKIYTEPTISVRSYSLYRYIRESELIFGLSGTVGLDKETLDFQKKVWRIDRPPIILPEFAIPQLVEIKPSINLRTLEEWDDAIYKELNSKKDQPVLIITENPDRARATFNYLKKKSLYPSIYEESSDKHILEEKMGPNRIIITTNLGGRGSDYQYDSKLSPKGLHVIIGFDSDEERILAQARGRAGRAGNPGSWRKISFGPILKQKPNLDEIKTNVRNTIGEDIIFEIYIYIKTKLESQYPKGDRILNSRLTFLMSWLSKPDIRELLITNITASYKTNINTLIAAFVLTKWHTSEKPDSKISYDENNVISIDLSKKITPHLDELFRLN